MPLDESISEDSVYDRYLAIKKNTVAGLAAELGLTTAGLLYIVKRVAARRETEEGRGSSTATDPSCSQEQSEDRINANVMVPGPLPDNQKEANLSGNRKSGVADAS